MLSFDVSHTHTVTQTFAFGGTARTPPRARPPSRPRTLAASPEYCEAACPSQACAAVADRAGGGRRVSWWEHVHTYSQRERCVRETERQAEGEGKYWLVMRLADRHSPLCAFMLTGATDRLPQWGQPIHPCAMSRFPAALLGSCQVPYLAGEARHVELLECLQQRRTERLIRPLRVVRGQQPACQRVLPVRHPLDVRLPIPMSKRRVQPSVGWS